MVALSHNLDLTLLRERILTEGSTEVNASIGIVSKARPWSQSSAFSLPLSEYVLYCYTYQRELFEHTR